MTTDPLGTDPSGPEQIPGLVISAPDGYGTTNLERAAYTQLQALYEKGRLTVNDSLLVALITDLARTVGMGARLGKAAGVAMAAKQLLDAIDKLPPLVDDSHTDDWGEVTAILRGEG